MKLYEIADQFRIIDAMLDDSGGELTPEIEAALSSLEGELEAKVDGIGALVREAKMEGRVYSEEAARLMDKASVCRNRVARLSYYLMTHLKAIGRDKVKGSRFLARVALSPTPTITWAGDVNAIPDGFTRLKVELDGKACQAAERQGCLPEGFTVKRTQYLDLR